MIFNFQAGLLISFVNIAGTSACGASLITSNRLVTAAHCWYDGFNQASQFVVVLGTSFLFSGGTRIATNQVFMHPDWSSWFFANDIAMIYLPINVPLSGNIVLLIIIIINGSYQMLKLAECRMLAHLHSCICKCIS